MPRQQQEGEAKRASTARKSPSSKVSLEVMTDGLLLLDKNLSVSVSTPYAQQVLRMDGLPFTLSPSFEIFSDEPAEKFARFVTTKSRQVKPLILLLEGGKPERDLMLLTCFKVMAEDERQELGETQFMIRIVHSNYYSDTKWQLFAEHFNLSQTESKLCRALADGLTLQEYAELKDVSINTARTQLNTIFTKTSTAKQTSLLRLIFLFARA